MKGCYSKTCWTGENVGQNSYILPVGYKLVQLIWRNNFTLFNKDEDAFSLWVVIPLLSPKETCLREPRDMCIRQVWGRPRNLHFNSSISTVGGSLYCKGLWFKAYNVNSNLSLELGSLKACGCSQGKTPWGGVLGGRGHWPCDYPRTKTASLRVWENSLLFPVFLCHPWLLG